MQVSVLTSTPNPLLTIGLSAGICYGKDDTSAKRVENCIKSGHWSVLEHASATFQASDISRACTHQLVRHRLASYSQQSQRYCRINVDNDDWYVMPPDISSGGENAKWFKQKMSEYAHNYQNALREGFKPEDARYLLPEACKTEIAVTMNFREFLHFVKLRTGKGAQWEIKDLALNMVSALAKESEQWERLVVWGLDAIEVDIPWR